MDKDGNVAMPESKAQRWNIQWETREASIKQDISGNQKTGDAMGQRQNPQTAKY